RRLVDPKPVGRRFRQGALPGARLEWRHAELERDRAAAQLMLSQSCADSLRELEERRLDLRAVEGVAIEGVGVPDRLRHRRLTLDLAILVDALRPVRAHRTVLAQAGLEERGGRPREVAAGPHPQVREHLLGLGADT